MYTVPFADGLFRAGYALNTDLYKAYSQYMAAENAKRPKRTLMEELMSPNIPIIEMSVTDAQINSAADSSEIAVIAIGRNAGEGNDRKEADDYYLTQKELALIKAVSTDFHDQKEKRGCNPEYGWGG